MLKLIGAVFIVFAGAVCGSDKSSALRRRYTACQLLRVFLTDISVMIRYRGMNVYEIASELKADEKFSSLSFVEKLPSEFDANSDFHLLWEKAILGDGTLGSDESKLLCTVGDYLGTSDTEGQLLSLEGSLAVLRDIEKMRYDEYRRKGRLYRSLGVLFGVMAGILLI